MLTASGTPGGVWSSSATGTATVGTAGNVSGVAGGTATISYTVTNSCGSVAATRIVTVNPVATPGTISGTATVCVGSVTMLTASGTPGGVWSSSATGTATVGTAGNVSGVAGGTATISYTVTNSCGSVSATRIVTVSPVATPGTISGTATVCVGAGTTLTASGTPGGVWSSTAIGTATIGTAGNVSGVAAGTATISYTVTNSCGSVAATRIVTVSPLANPGSISGSTSILAGGTTTLTATVGGGTWSSGTPSVATIGTTGIVTGVSVGSSVISYAVTNSCSVAYATATINVSSATGNALAFSSSYVNVPAVIASAGSYTKEAWVYINSHSGSNNIISAFSHPFYIPTYMRAQNGGGGEVVDPTPFPLSTWVHVAVTYDAATTTMKLYRGGTLVASSSTAGTGHVSEQIQLGAYGSSNFLNGKLDEVRVWNVARTASQIADNMNCDVAQQPGLVAYYRFDQGIAGGNNTGTTYVSDYSGLGNCGTLNGFSLTGSASNFVAGVVSGCVPISLPAPAAITGTTVVCAGSTSSLGNAQSGGVWSASNGNITIGSASGTVTGVSAGTSTVSYTLNCVTVTTVVTVSVPIVGAGSNTSVCMGSGTTLTASGASTYIWSPAIGLSSSLGASITASPTVTTTYTVTGYNAFGCSGTASVTVSVNPLPAAGTISGSSMVLAGGSVSLSASATGGVWSSGTPAVATVGSASGVVVGIAAGSSIISYAVSNSCGTVYATHTVTVSASGGNALAFNSSYVSIPAVIATGGSYTKEAWVYLNDFSGANNVVSSTSNAFWIPGQLRAYNNGGGIIADSETFPLNVWTHIAVTYDAATNLMKLYRGGVVVASLSAGSGHISEPMQLGAFNSANFLNGKLDEVRIWNVARTDSQIYGNMNCDVAQHAGLVAYYRFDQGTAGANNTSLVNVTDYSGNGNCGTFNGFALTGTTTNFVTGVVPGCNPINPTTPPAITGSSVVCAGGTSALGNALTGGTWSASNGNVTVGSTSGIVTGVSAGTSVVSYTRLCHTVTTIVTVSVPMVSAGAGTAVCSGNSTSLSATGASAYVWLPATGLSSTAGGSVVASPATTTTYTVTGYNAFGCSAAASVTVSVNPLPSAISGSVSMALAGSTTLTATPATGVWTTSNAAIASVGSATGIVYGENSGNAVITYTLPTGCFRTTTVNVGLAGISGPSTFCVGATASYAHAVTGGSWSSSNPSVATINITTGIAIGIGAGTAIITYNTGTAVQIIAVTVTATPGPISGETSVCVGSDVLLTHESTGGTWSGGGGYASVNEASGIVTGLSAGTANITYTLYEGCTRVQAVTVKPLPTAISGPSSVCVGASVTLTSGTGGTWSSSNPEIATVPVYAGVVTGVTAGSATLTFRNTTTGCSVTRSVVVVGAPASISGTPVFCVGKLAAFSSTTPGGTWASSAVGVANPGTIAGTFTGGATGTSVITYSVGGCITTLVVTVANAPGVLSGTPSLCAGSTTTLFSATPGQFWSSSDASVATAGSATSTSGIINGVSPGTATISYSNASGCATTVIVTVNAALPTISGGNSVCVGGTTSLINSVPGGTWQSSATSVATVSGFGVLTAIAAGTATITYRTNSTCFTTKVVTVSTAPADAISGTAKVCIGFTTTLSHSVADGSWSSSNAARATVGSSSGVVTGVSAGTAVITYFTSPGCYSTIVVTVNALPAAIGGGLSPICVGNTTALTNVTTGGSWISNGDFATVGSTSGIVTGVDAGVATITYVVAASGCSVTKLITVNANPSAVIGTNPVCVGSSTTWSSSSVGGSWVSSRTAVAGVGLTSGIITPIAAGTSLISYTMPGGCRVTTILTVNALPGTFSGTPTLCAGSITTLTATTASLTWSSDNMAVATVSPISALVGRVDGLSPGTALISYTNAAGCARTVVVTVNAAPSSIAGGTSVCIGGTIGLSSASFGGTWSSSSPVATVGLASGIVTGVSAGVANITYRTGATCFTTQTINVNTSPADAITGPSSVCMGATVSLSHPVSGGTWVSSNTTRATVSPSGNVTGVTAGAVGITYYVSGGCFRTFNMSVSSYVMPVSGTYTVCVGGATTLSTASSGGVWTSSAPSVASIVPSTGVFTGISAGTANIVYTLSSTGCSSSKIVTVHPLPDPITGPGTVCVGSTIAMSSTTVGGTWLSAAGVYATVDAATGVVNGVAASPVNISYANSFGCRTHTRITVNPLPATITGIAVVNELSSTTLACATPGGTWSSSDAAVGTINSATGVLTGVSTGNTTITYQLTATGCVRTRVATVNPFGSRPFITDPTSGSIYTRIFPSPTNGVITVDAPGTGVLSVLTIDGRALVTYHIVPANNTVQLPHNLAHGIYVCRFVADDGAETIARIVYAP
jgi:uncharacterized protein YjdB